MENKTNLQMRNRLQKVLDTRYDIDKDTIESLENLSTFTSENFIQLDSRRNLKFQIEKRSLDLNKKFLASFFVVKSGLDEICTEVKDMRSSINTMKTNLEKTQFQTQELITQTGQLRKENENLKLRQKVSTAFINHFQLNQSDYEILYGKKRDDPITKEFFVVLDRVGAISRECKTLLMQNGYETIALDILEQMTLHLEGGLERLYKFALNHCRNPIDTNSEMGNLVLQAMSKLQDRPVLLNYVLQEFAVNRRAYLSKIFIDALTVGEASGKSGPIELHINDPKRYLGDLFAWLHQALPTERENLMMLCKNCDKSDISDLISNAMSSITDGICHTLKIRVEMVLNGAHMQKDTIILYAIANLIRFYHNIMTSMVKEGNLEICLKDLMRESERTYLNSLSMQVKEILQNLDNFVVQTHGNELQPPPSVGKLLNILKEILSVASMVEDRQQDINKIVSYVIDPLIQSITESAVNLAAQDMSVYLLNCLYHIQNTLAIYEFTDDFIERLNAQSEAQIDSLTAGQVSSLVTNLNLAPLYTVLQTNSDSMSVHHIKAFMSKLDAFLEIPEVLLIPQINLLQSNSHRSTIQKRSFNVLISMYKQIYEKVFDPKNNYQNPESLLSRTPDQLAAILNG